MDVPQKKGKNVCPSSPFRTTTSSTARRIYKVRRPLIPRRRSLPFHADASAQVWDWSANPEARRED